MTTSTHSHKVWTDEGGHVKAAEEMGHKPGLHINAYGTRLEKPKLQRKIAEQDITRAKQ